MEFTPIIGLFATRQRPLVAEIVRGTVQGREEN